MERPAPLRSATVVAPAGKETTKRVPRVVSRKTVAVSPAAIADPRWEPGVDFSSARLRSAQPLPAEKTHPHLRTGSV